MLHLTSANCTHLPAEGYARGKSGWKEGIARREGTGPSRGGNGEIRCVRDTVVVVVMERGAGEFHAFVG